MTGQPPKRDGELVPLSPRASVAATIWLVGVLAAALWPLFAWVSARSRL